MGFLSKFEGKMEDTLEGAADRMVNSPISPVQIAKKAEKKMRREKMVGAGRQYAPTLYTVLVNPDDDERLFGYYPTLAGETETYLAAKAVEEGLVMDGQPLVRFIVDDSLRHGKFDIIAEAVAAPIIAQLRQEEMERYGLANGRGGAYGAGGAAYGASYGASNARAAGAGAGAAAAYAPVPQSAPAYGSIDAPAAQDAFGDSYAYGSGAPGEKPPLPYVPEDEIDYSIDYGEYTFDSQNFEDYRDPAAREAAVARAGVGAAGVGAAGAGVAGAAGVAAGGAPVADNTIVFTAGAAAATPTPTAGAIRARLVDATNNRTYDLATARLIIGRESSCDISISDINISRTHAELRFESQGAWLLTDLGSTNGTFVNGKEVSSQLLRAGDHITLGMTNLVFEQF